MGYSLATMSRPIAATIAVVLHGGRCVTRRSFCKDF
jgi:hypothetical protein